MIRKLLALFIFFSSIAYSSTTSFNEKFLMEYRIFIELISAGKNEEFKKKFQEYITTLKAKQLPPLHPNSYPFISQTHASTNSKSSHYIQTDEQGKLKLESLKDALAQIMVHKGNVSLLQYFLDQGFFDLHKEYGISGNLLLREAIYSHKPDIVNFLLEKGVGVNEPNSNSLTPLDIAISLLHPTNESSFAIKRDADVVKKIIEIILRKGGKCNYYKEAVEPYKETTTNSTSSSKIFSNVPPVFIPSTPKLPSPKLLNQLPFPRSSFRPKT